MISSPERNLLATLVERSLLTKQGSTKEVWHVVLDVPSPSFSYDVGDSLAVFAENDPREIESLLHFFQLSEGVKKKDPKTQEEHTLLFLLRDRFDLSKVPLQLARLVEQTTSASRREPLNAFIQQHTHHGALHIPVNRFLRAFASPALSFDSFFHALSPLLPRSYSLSSSPKQSASRAELTVSLVSHDILGEVRHGLCSHFLTARAPLRHPSIRVFVHKAPHFRLPQEKEAPIIMIGPGTGIAPFRAFLQELEQTRSSLPPCWLFFGDRHQQYDFLYEDYFSRLHHSGRLLMNLAFSRDSDQKVYVQHVMWEERRRLASWIDAKGAYLYICGNAKQMARDVEKTLLDILVDQQVASTIEDARAYLRRLHHTKRYCRDIY